MTVWPRILALFACAATLGVSSFAGTMTGQDPNGIEDLPAEEIALEAHDATEVVQLRAKGKMTFWSEQLRMDLALNPQGDCAGTIGQGGNTAELIRADDASYVKGDADFWKAADVDSDMVNQFADQWVKISDQLEGAEDLAELCALDSLLEPVVLSDLILGGPGVTKGEVHKVDGKLAIPVTAKDGDVTVRIEVATEGEPYILKLTESGSDEPRDVAFSEFNKPVKVKAPDAEDVIDLALWPRKFAGLIRPRV